MTDARNALAPDGRDAASSTANVARMYDYYLGGKDNYAIDRQCAQRVISTVPLAREIARANRAFLGRVVRYLAAEAGISQFIDIGAGLPTQDNVHQVAQRANPAARVVYVDNDPVVLGRVFGCDQEVVRVRSLIQI
ncbi:SAM-dependent methyltransferase, partial [Sphaerimonospora cavernae]